MEAKATFSFTSNVSYQDLKGQMYNSPLLSSGDMFQYLQWMFEITDITKPYIYYAFSSICMPMVKQIYKLDMVRD